MASYVREDDGTYIISTHAEIRSLLHDKRLSSEDLPKSKHARTGNPLADLIVNPVKDWIMDTHRALIYRDPPDHTNLRRLVMAQFTPERVRSMAASPRSSTLSSAKCAAARKSISSAIFLIPCLSS
jgi:cytochrome P450